MNPTLNKKSHIHTQSHTLTVIPLVIEPWMGSDMAVMNGVAGYVDAERVPGLIMSLHGLLSRVTSFALICGHAGRGPWRRESVAANPRPCLAGHRRRRRRANTRARLAL